MERSDDQMKLHRRHLVKGAVWSTPLVIMSSTSPAYAASCSPSVSGYGGGVTYSWGNVVSPDVTANTTQVLGLGAGEVTVTGLSSTTTVTSITVEQWIERRNGQDSRGPGSFYIGNPTSNFVKNGYLTSDEKVNFSANGTPDAYKNFTSPVNNGFNIGTPYPAPNSGYSPTVQFTNSTTSPDSTLAASWKATYTWTAAQNSQTNNYSGGDAAGCRTFTTNSSGRFNITYLPTDSANVRSSWSTDSWVKRAPYVYSLITVTLSNQAKLTRVSRSW